MAPKPNGKKKAAGKRSKAGVPASDTAAAGLPRSNDDGARIAYAEQQSSVTITRNAKGQAQFEVKVYSFDPEYAAEKAMELYTRLAAMFPGKFTPGE